MTTSILVLLDTATDELTEVPGPVLELITMGRALGRVDVVTLSAPTLPVLATLGQYGVHGVHQATLPVSAGPNARRVTSVLSAVLVAAVNRIHADLLLVPNSFIDKEAAAVAAVRLQAGFINNALTIAPPNDKNHFTVHCRVFGGSWDVGAEVTTDPAVISVQAGGVTAAPAEVATAPEVYPLSVDVSPPQVTVVSRETVARDTARPDLASAREVVAGGRGCNEDLTPVFELADALGAAVGVTRDLAFDGIFDTYIGTTGVTVAPELYIACGISGSPYHTGGMRSSRYIISVN
ncbi:MAG: electron transfer flavoprotein subunit alpha/FixB family protein, partial [Cellulomonadaceae bacterium]|nr:electron transfer flavoprotein subunit alpha/FixB family protein [Cellulomonadaceae bacterium]